MKQEIERNPIKKVRRIEITQFSAPFLYILDVENFSIQIVQYTNSK